MTTDRAVATLGGMRTHTKRSRRNLPGAQHLWGFDNGHLCSVVPDAEHTDVWQLAVLDGNGRPRQKTALAAGVIGCLRPIDIRRILRQIEALQ